MVEHSMIHGEAVVTCQCADRGLGSTVKSADDAAKGCRCLTTSSVQSSSISSLGGRDT